MNDHVERAMNGKSVSQEIQCEFCNSLTTNEKFCDSCLNILSKADDTLSRYGINLF